MFLQTKKQLLTPDQSLKKQNKMKKQSKQMKILMVCLGNICRSPMAEGIMRSKINERGLNIEVDSCGTAAYHVGDPPDIRAQKTIRNHQNDISQLRGRQFQISDFDKFDIIFTMDKDNYHDILSLARTTEDKNKVDMILNTLYPGENIPVPDPYYGILEDYEDNYKTLELACNKILDDL